MPVRNAASVLPEPVGACTSTCAPVAIAGQAASCAGVGAGERALEPGPRLRREGSERVHLLRVSRSACETRALSRPPVPG